MLTKTEESKVLRDPIHRYIHIDDQVVWDAIHSREFQRLRRIHQLGGVYQVYPGAEHSRFTHSLGVYEIARRILASADSSLFSEEERVATLLAALLHDLGHGPYSHFFEQWSAISHEEMTIKIIQDPKSEIYQILEEAQKGLSKKVTSILCGTYAKKCLHEMVSSQLDADRMDYLLRDAFESGTSYGVFDLERILRTLRFHQGHLCVTKGGMHAIEDYIMARYQMYWQVYLHPDASGYELLISQFFKRYLQIRPSVSIPVFETLFSGELNCDDFFLLDEHTFFAGFVEAMNCDDPVLKNFAEAIINRKLFVWKENPDLQDIEILKDLCTKHDLDPDLYVVCQNNPVRELLPYQESGQPSIQVLMEDGSLVALSEVSAIARAMMQVHQQKMQRVYYPAFFHTQFEILRNRKEQTASKKGS